MRQRKQRCSRRLTRQPLRLLSVAVNAKIVVEVELGAELDAVNAIASAAVALAGAVPVFAFAEDLPANVSAKICPECLTMRKRPGLIRRLTRMPGSPHLKTTLEMFPSTTLRICGGIGKK